jgi:hypothetical protein
MAMSEGPRDHVHRLREQTRWTWFPLLLATSLTACAPTDRTPWVEVVEPGAHPFDRLPEAQLEELGSLGRDGLPFTVGSTGALAPVSDTSFVALVREPGAEASGIAHVTLGGEILAWVASSGEIETWTRRRLPNFGVSGDSVWIFASDGSNYVLILRSLDGDDFGRRLAPTDASSAFQQGAVESVVGLVAGGSGFVDTSPSLPPLPRRVFPLSAVLVESAEGSPGDTLFRGAETRPGPAGGFFTRAGLFGVPFEPFGHPPLHHLASTGDRLVVVNWDEDDPGDLEIRVWSFPSGETRDMRVPLPRLRMTDDHRARALDAGVRLLDEMERRRERTSPTLPPWRTGPEALQDYVHFPPFMPSVRAVHSGEDGTIWLLRDELLPLYLGGEPQERGMITWVALNPEGVPLFRVSLPERSRLVMASRSEIWTASMEDGRLIQWGVGVPEPNDDRAMGRVHPGRPDAPPAQEAA